MVQKLTVRYDREADTVYLNACPAYPEQVLEEPSDEVLVRRNPLTGRVENIGVLNYLARLEAGEEVQLPVVLGLELAESA